MQILSEKILLERINADMEEEKIVKAKSPVDLLPAIKASQPTGVIKEVINKETKDLYLAAAYHAEGCRFLELDKSDKSRMVFKYEGGENADRVERQWYEGVLVVSATAYSASIRLCKSMIHS